MTDPQRKFALITGCTPGGIGHFLSLEFAKQGFTVLSTVRDPSKYTPPHPSMTYLPLELSSDESMTTLLTTVSALTNSKLHILYNNAGRNYTVPALDISAAELQATFSANLFSVIRLCQLFAPLLIAAKGTIVQTGSLAGIMPYVFGSAYNASKAALHAYSDTLRLELEPLGVRVITVVTGGVKSNIARTHRDLPLNSYYTPLAEEYERRLTHSQQLGMDTEQYARSVVRQVLAGDGWLTKTRWIWDGKMSWIVWLGWFCMPRVLFEWYFRWNFKLWKLEGTARERKDL
ncbi:hypothetical protein BCR34DRAFT_553590 [Clohesyomyces aquaticus]|uniref:NAD(P)-binding protein n=1 Tax=Clohesyomyces aquaticus TaxID=1231657 RepID=A0A1Y2A958_9PLEO|nr:hypothetical protein BCR34DRAFT_553590 [Clohesyomyces aquaticus]